MRKELNVRGSYLSISGTMKATFRIENGRFRLLRRIAGISQLEVAANAGVSSSVVEMTEQEGSEVDAECVLRILRSYNIDPRDADADFFYVDPDDKLRPGKQHHRDRDFGIKDPDFWHWWHREGKDAYGGEDMKPEDDPQKIYREWKADGSPVPKELAEL